MQLRFATGLTCEEYVKQKTWLIASLPTCPLHPRGGCGFARHTAYERATPKGAFIARYYCRKGQTTFSLLPDCLASRLSSTLAAVEQAAEASEAITESRELVAELLRPDIERQGALRWLHRRVVAVRAVLVTAVGLLPSLLAGCELTIQSFRNALGVDRVLPALREKLAGQLPSLPPPVGFGPRPVRRNKRHGPSQQKAGADPPRSGAPSSTPPE